MVKTDRRIIASNGRTSLEITNPPFYVKETEGFDELSVTTVTSQGFDQDGATIINTYVESREMSITGQIKADTTQQMEMLMNKLENLFLPKTDITLNHYYMYWIKTSISLESSTYTRRLSGIRNGTVRDRSRLSFSLPEKTTSCCRSRTSSTRRMPQKQESLQENTWT